MADKKRVLLKGGDPLCLFLSITHSEVNPPKHVLKPEMIRSRLIAQRAAIDEVPIAAFRLLHRYWTIAGHRE